MVRCNNKYSFVNLRNIYNDYRYEHNHQQGVEFIKDIIGWAKENSNPQFRYFYGRKRRTRYYLPNYMTIPRNDVLILKLKFGV